MVDQKEINLKKLEEGMLGVTSPLGSMHKEACIVCLADQGHSNGTELKVRGKYKDKYTVRWDEPITDQLIRSYGDHEVATENAAYGISFLILEDLTGYKVISKSCKGTGFDYWLGTEDNDDLPPFINELRLEVSGIRNGSDSTIRARVKRKKEQTNPSDHTMLPALISVVEFSRPIAQVEEK